MAYFATQSIVPVRTSAPDSANMAAMVIGALLENTDITSSVVTMPSSRKATAPIDAVTAGGNRSVTKRAKTASRSARPI